MAAATQSVPALLTLEEYLNADYHPDCDFVDGHLEKRPLGEFEHSIIQSAVGSWFFSRRVEWKIRVASEYRTRVADQRVRNPDISVFTQGKPAEKVRVTAPLLAIEILSPQGRMHPVITRLKDFASMGVENIWLLDPIDRVAYTFAHDALHLVEGSLLTIQNSPIFLDLAEVFSALD